MSEKIPSPSSLPLVEIQDLSKTFSSLTALKHIQTVIPSGKIIGIVGHDGAGKTTLIRLMAGLLLPSQGTISVAGYDTVKQAEFIHHLIGYMPQKFGLYEDLTVMQNLRLYADLKGVAEREKGATFNKLLSFTNLAPFTSRLAKDLSGGMKQKLGLACALIKKPALLLLDEPSVGVDPISRRELWKMIDELIDEGISVVWSTAYLDEAERCHTVLLLNQGELLYSGSPGEVTKRVEGRVFSVTNIERNKRRLLAQILNQQHIIDGVIQGKNIRLVTEQPLPPLEINSFQKAPLNIEPTAPRFEDAFIDILGGGPGGFSVLADKTPQISGDSTCVVKAEHLTKKFGNFTAASDISFTIQRGEIFGLLGPNGAGKSTTFKMMCGLLRPTSGRAFVNELDLQVAPGDARARIGYMAQKFSLYGTLSVKQNLKFFSGIYNVKNHLQTQIMEQMIEIFGLEPYLDISADTLALGFKQRLALACATMHHPEVLFLDEPTSGVDPITRREFWNHINGLVEKGVTVMVTTHFMEEAEYCDRIALIYQGKMIRLGTPDDLKESAKTSENAFPSLEDAFVKLIHQYDEKK